MDKTTRYLFTAAALFLPLMSYAAEDSAANSWIITGGWTLTLLLIGVLWKNNDNAIKDLQIEHKASRERHDSEIRNARERHDKMSEKLGDINIQMALLVSYTKSEQRTRSNTNKNIMDGLASIKQGIRENK